MQVASAKDPNPVYGAVTYYGRITEIWELDYRMFTIPVFMCDWVDLRAIEIDSFGFTTVNFARLSHQSERFILASQARQVFYVQDQENDDKSVVGFTPHKMYKYRAADEVDDILEFDANVHTKQQLLEDLEDELMCTRPDGEGIYA